ncbi:MAG: aminotransferase class I/II-fold pyridoxal phosphate-dependent enzyme [Lachnospiraceae bacterium]|nr:aminotransferase class I/II-fold pyridoxal phosphate-dependent enzyme [Lachnospiraceae bacterium]
MKYDFTSIIDRKNKDASALDMLALEDPTGNTPKPAKEGFDEIPMWVADMHFATAPSVTKELEERIRHPLYGYFMQKDEYYNAIINWQEKRNHVTGLQKEHIGYENGVHGCVATVVEKFTNPGDRVLMYSPVYVGFKYDVDAIGRISVYSELKKDENGIYRMDFDDMERKIRENNIHLTIFCSPHNPTGRVWERWELERALKIFEDNDVYVVSDEIWADLTYSGHQHIPTQMVNDWARNHTVAVYSPSKNFNLAGLGSSYHIIYNDFLRARMGHTHYNEQNVLSYHALIGAYSEEGAEWTDELREVLHTNCEYVANYLNSIDGIEVTVPQGTYMLFADLTKYCEKTGRNILDVLQAGWDVGVAWQNGRDFNGPCHIRLNMASPLSRMQEACRRMEKYVFTKQNL